MAIRLFIADSKGEAAWTRWRGWLRSRGAFVVRSRWVERVVVDERLVRCEVLDLSRDPCEDERLDDERCPEPDRDDDERRAC